MNNFKIINWLVWLVLVILWNYSYPEASPFLDVIVAVMLSLLNLVLIKLKKEIIMNVDYFKSALLHHSKGNWNKAKEIYEHILKSNPNNYSVLQNYGPLLSQLKEYKLAKNIFEKSLKIKPKDPLLLYNYAKFYHDQRIFEKAITLYKDLIRLNQEIIFQCTILVIFIFQLTN